MHILFSVTLLALCLTSTFTPSPNNDSDSYCAKLSFLGEQIVILTFASILIVLRHLIKGKVEQIKVISDLDLKIRWSYNRYLSQLKHILYVIWVFQLFKLVYPILTYWKQGYCDF